MSLLGQGAESEGQSRAAHQDDPQEADLSQPQELRRDTGGFQEP